MNAFAIGFAVVSLASNGTLCTEALLVSVDVILN